MTNLRLYTNNNFYPEVGQKIGHFLMNGVSYTWEVLYGYSASIHGGI